MNLNFKLRPYSSNEKIARDWCRREGCHFIKMADDNSFIFEWMCHSFKRSIRDVKNESKTT